MDKHRCQELTASNLEIRLDANKEFFLVQKMRKNSYNCIKINYCPFCGKKLEEV